MIMNIATQIYEQIIRQLPADEHLRLATLILEDLSQDTQSGQLSKNVSRKLKLSARQIHENRREETGIFKTSAETDEYHKADHKS